MRPEDIIDTDGTGNLTDKNVKYANLKDCGGANIDGWKKRIVDPNGLDGMGPETQGISRLCPGLTGGKTFELLAHCKKMLPDTDHSYTFTSSGRPICTWPGDTDLPRTTLMPTVYTNSDVCWSAFDKEIGGQNKKYVMLYKYKVKETRIECFYMKKCRLMEILNIGEPCEKPVLKLTRQNEKGGGFKEIEGNIRYYGGPVFLELDYENEQEENSFFATLEWDIAKGGRTGRTEVLLSRTPEDASLYRSGEIFIEPWTPISDAAGVTSFPSAAQEPLVVRP